MKVIFYAQISLAPILFKNTKQRFKTRVRRARMPLVFHPLRLPHFSKLSLQFEASSLHASSLLVASVPLPFPLLSWPCSPNSVDDRTDNLNHFYDLSAADNFYSKISIHTGNKIIKTFSTKSINLGPKSIIEPLQTAFLML